MQDGVMKALAENVRAVQKLLGRQQSFGFRSKSTRAITPTDAIAPFTPEIRHSHYCPWYCQLCTCPSNISRDGKTVLVL